MILVAGLAAAGLVGIAAAFYFSIRSGSRRDRRMRAAGANRAGAGANRVGTGRNPGSRNGTARPDRTTARRVAVPGRPAAVAGRRAGTRTGELAGARRTGDRPEPPEQAWPEDAWPDDVWPDHPAEDGWPEDPAAAGSRPGSRPAARLSREAHAAEIAAKAHKPRRRVGFRKGADLDEELWPTETFGGVSDEQFWDDLASDKPLTTTARTAQPEPATPRTAKPEPATTRTARPGPAGGRAAQREAGTRSRPLDTGQATDPQGRRAAGSDFSPKPAPDFSPTPTLDAYPGPRSAPDPAAERTAIQPAYTATQPVPSMTTPPRGTAIQPSETRRRRPSSSEEDPLTSAAFALRPSGPVDGRSALRARDRSAGRTGSDPVSAGSYGGGTSPYPYASPSYGDPSPVTQTMNTPPYGENYGNGNGPGRHGAHAAPVSESRLPGARSYQGSHQAAGRHQATGSYPVGGAYPVVAYPGNGYSGNGHQSGGYHGNGYRGNGHRAPYDPRDDYRRLAVSSPALS